MSYWRKRNSSEEAGGGTSTHLSESTPEVEKRPTPGRTTSNPPAVRASETAAEGDDSLDLVGSEQLEDLILERFGKPRSALGPGTTVQGKLTFDTPVRIDGQLSGDIQSSRAVIVGRSGYVEARIEAAELIVFGYVRSEMVKTRRLEILGGGCVEASVESSVLVVEQGATLRGSCTMGGRESIELGSVRSSFPESAVHHPGMGTDLSKEQGLSNDQEWGTDKPAKFSADSEIVLAGGKGSRESLQGNQDSGEREESATAEALVKDTTAVQAAAAPVS